MDRERTGKRKSRPRANEEISKKTKKKQKSNDRNTKIFAVVIFLLFIIYICGYFFMMFNRESVSTSVVLSGRVDNPLSLEGVIIRDEVVYQSEKAGLVNFVSGDLEKIANGTLVAVVTNENAEEIKKEQIDIEKKMLELQEFRDDLSIAQKDAHRINSQIKVLLENQVFDFSDDNINGMYTLREEIEKKINLRNMLLLEDNRGSISGMYEQRNETLKELNENEHEIIVKDSGIVSYLIDDYEGVYNLLNMYELSKDDIKGKIKDVEPVTKRKVEVSDNVFKLLKSNIWYIASYIDSRLITGWVEGSTLNIFIDTEDGYRKIPVKINKIIPKEKESYVVFESSKYILDFLEKRKINFRITETEETGLKIPNSSIVEKTLLSIPNQFIKDIDESSKVLLKLEADSKISEIPVEIFKSVEEESFILLEENAVNRDDTIVLPEDSGTTYVLNKVSNVFGVLKVTSGTGVARFTEITLDALPADDADFTILDPSKNPRIKMNDIIITDGRQSEDGDRVLN